MTTETTEDKALRLTKLGVAKITADPDVQQRCGTDSETVNEYMDSMERGDKFPPLIVYRDDKAGELWLAGGFHRFAAYRKRGTSQVVCEMRRGDRRAASLFAAGTNADHGLPRTRADKRRAVETVIRFSKKNISSRVVAERARVSHTFVDKLRATMAQPTANGASVETGGNVAAVRVEERETKDGRTITVPPLRLVGGKRTATPTTLDTPQDRSDRLQRNRQTAQDRRTKKWLQDPVDDHRDELKAWAADNLRCAEINMGFTLDTGLGIGRRHPGVILDYLSSIECLIASLWSFVEPGTALTCEALKDALGENTHKTTPTTDDNETVDRAAAKALKNIGGPKKKAARRKATRTGGAS